MNSSILDAIVIGAGPAGLSIGYHLKKLGLNYAIFEKGKIGDTWRNQRWDSFKLNSPNKINHLPGTSNGFADGEGFCTSSEFVTFMENYSGTFQLPVHENSRVISVENGPDVKEYRVCVSRNGSREYYLTQKLVVASGVQNKKIIPSFAGTISGDVLQLHTSEYRNVSELPEGAVLVVGSAQSGVQIAEDLINSNRKVFVSTSQVSRFPRRYRNKDITDWLILTGFYDVRSVDVTDPGILKMRQPQISNIGLRGHTLSLQGLARHGVVILGKTEHAGNRMVFLNPNAADNVRFADNASRNIKIMIDDFIRKSRIEASSREEDPEDEYDETAACVSDMTSLNLHENKINTVIWATGFTGDFSYLKFPVFDNTGTLKHRDGISDIEGLCFLGFPWLRKRKSGIILGFEEDAEYIATHISDYPNI